MGLRKPGRVHADAEVFTCAVVQSFHTCPFLYPQVVPSYVLYGWLVCWLVGWLVGCEPVNLSLGKQQRLERITKCHMDSKRTECVSW